LGSSKRSLERTRCRWEGDVKMACKEIGCEGVNWTELHFSIKWPDFIMATSLIIENPDLLNYYNRKELCHEVTNLKIFYKGLHQ
jgi:hypothetical protein